MGHSFVVFRGVGLLLKDKDIAIWIGCLLSEADTAPPSEGLKAMFTYWLSPEAFPGQGCFLLKLDDFLKEEHTRRELVALNDSAIMHVKASAGPVPAEYLNQHIEALGYVFIALPIPRILEVLTQFRDLLNGIGLPVPP